MKKLKGKKHVRPRRNAVTTVPRPRRNVMTKVPRHGFDPAATAACQRIIDDPDVPWPIRDLTATLLTRSIARQS
jgi:hypothetical protein